MQERDDVTFIHKDTALLAREQTFLSIDQNITRMINTSYKQLEDYGINLSHRNQVQAKEENIPKETLYLDVDYLKLTTALSESFDEMKTFFELNFQSSNNGVIFSKCTNPNFALDNFSIIYNKNGLSAPYNNSYKIALIHNSVVSYPKYTPGNNYSFGTISGSGKFIGLELFCNESVLNDQEVVDVSLKTGLCYKLNSYLKELESSYSIKKRIDEINKEIDKLKNNDMKRLDEEYKIKTKAQEIAFAKTESAIAKANANNEYITQLTQMMTNKKK
jgi:hypothetical protein